MLSSCLESTSSGKFLIIQKTYLASCSLKYTSAISLNLVFEETNNKVINAPRLGKLFLCLASGLLRKF